MRGGRAASRIQSTDATVDTRHTAVSPSRGIENREGGFLAQEPDEDVGGLVCSAENRCIEERRTATLFRGKHVFEYGFCAGRDDSVAAGINGFIG